MKTPQQVAALFGCSVAQATRLMAQNAAQLRQMKGKTKKEANWLANRASAIEKVL